MSLTGRGRRKGVTVVPQTPDGLLRAFHFDSTLTMRETNAAPMHRHPTQSSSDITDDVRHEPTGFICSGITTDTPVEFFTPPGDRAIELYVLIKDLQREVVPVTVLNSWTGRMLENMFPVLIDGDHSDPTATIAISLSFEKFRFSELTVIPGFVDSDILALGSQTVETSF